VAIIILFLDDDKNFSAGNNGSVDERNWGHKEKLDEYFDKQVDVREIFKDFKLSAVSDLLVEDFLDKLQPCIGDKYSATSGYAKNYYQRIARNFTPAKREFFEAIFELSMRTEPFVYSAESPDMLRHYHAENSENEAAGGLRATIQTTCGRTTLKNKRFTFLRYMFALLRCATGNSGMQHQLYTHLMDSRKQLKKDRSAMASEISNFIAFCQGKVVKKTSVTREGMHDATESGDGVEKGKGKGKGEESDDDDDDGDGDGDGNGDGDGDGDGESDVDSDNEVVDGGCREKDPNYVGERGGIHQSNSRDKSRNETAESLDGNCGYGSQYELVMSEFYKQDDVHEELFNKLGPIAAMAQISLSLSHKDDPQNFVYEPNTGGCINVFGVELFDTFVHLSVRKKNLKGPTCISVIIGNIFLYQSILGIIRSNPHSIFNNLTSIILLLPQNFDKKRFENMVFSLLNFPGEKDWTDVSTYKYG